MKFGVFALTLLFFILVSAATRSGRGLGRRKRHIWSEWSSWTACTRSCGTGISTRTRSCLNGKHKPIRSQTARCEGPKEETKVCNRQGCPVGVIDEFSRQCAKFNGQMLAGNRYTWVPFHRAGEECVLNCRAVGHKFYAQLKPKIEDGTVCGHDKVCLAGKCLGFGCDEIIKDGGYCAMSRGLFSNRFLPMGYNRITTIPASACNMTFQQVRPTQNNFAIKTLKGKYIFNGVSYKEGVLHSIQTDQGIFTYIRNESGERLVVPGPVKEPIELMLYTKQENLGITYEYYHSANINPFIDDKSLVSKKDLSHETLHHLRHQHHYSSNINYAHERPQEEIEKIPKKNSRYDWSRTGYSECTKTCAGGFQEATYVCKRLDRDMIVPDKRCSGSPKPNAAVRPCNNRPCIPEWITSDWGPCSATCGEGLQTREVQCKQQINSHANIVVTPAACAHSERPQTTKNCSLKPCESHGRWITGQWSECSSKCGSGTRTRSVKCSDAFCPEAEKPDDSGKCEGQYCSGNAEPIWVFTDWSKECNGYCGAGVEERRVSCYGGKDCDKYSEPLKSRRCEAHQEFCSGQWFTGPWSTCMGKCEWGERKRGVVCVSLLNDKSEVVLDSNCNISEKPANREYCELPPCDVEWYTSEWGDCTEGCNGPQDRRVVCLDEKYQESPKCYRTPQPPSSQLCEATSCNQVYQGNVTIHPNKNGCSDKLKNCRIAAQARMCAYDFYTINCCYSCSRKKKFLVN